MAVDNPWSIAYGGTTFGGSSDTFLLFGPYIIEKSFDTFRLVFDVLVVATDDDTLQTQSATLESAMRSRDSSVTITLDSATTLTNGTDILNVRGTATKSGSPDTDKRASRLYTCVIEAELPADDNSGLRDVVYQVDYQPGRQRIVTMQGVYTADGGNTALDRYETNFDAIANTFLTTVGGAAAYELVDENYTRDRNNHTVNFVRQYIELLANQSASTLDDTQIKDHRVTFTPLITHPGDSIEDTRRLRRTVATYDASADVTVTTDLQSLYENKIRPYLRQTFQNTFDPSVFAFEEERIAYDETSKRISVSIQFIYQPSGAAAVVEVQQSLAYRELRNIDYTPVHQPDELAFFADVGWAIIERVWSRSIVVVGDEFPHLRISEEYRAGPGGAFLTAVVGDPNELDVVDGTMIQDEGWNVISNTSQVTDQYVGTPDNETLKLSNLTETIVERLHRKPAGNTSTGSGGSNTSGGRPSQ